MLPFMTAPDAVDATAGILLDNSARVNEQRPPTFFPVA
jgi:hypothetical protein